MTVGGGFRRVARILRLIERDGWQIHSVVSRNGAELWTDRGIELQVCCSRQAAGDETATDGPMTLVEELREFDSCQARLHRVEEQTSGQLIADYDLDIVPPDAADDDQEPTQGTDHTPLHRDHGRLSRLYREHSTFTAMAEAVEDDVSPETIRRYTIEHGLHDPDGSDQTAEDRSHEIAESSTDANGHIDPAEVMATVERARTLYEVQQAFDIDREQTVALLRDYDVLDLVVGRLAGETDASGRREIIRERMHDAQDVDRPVAAGRNG